MRTLLLALLCILAAHAQGGNRLKDWNIRAAADYLDGRMAWWDTWPYAARDHDTFCTSCHTTLLLLRIGAAGAPQRARRIGSVSQ